MWEHVTGGVGPAQRTHHDPCVPSRCLRGTRSRGGKQSGQPTIVLAARVRTQARGPPAERRGTGLTGTPPPSLSLSARRGTAPPVPRPRPPSTSRRRHPGSYLQPHRRRARAGRACVTSNGHGQTAAQADKSRPPHRSARSHHVKWLAPGAAPGWTWMIKKVKHAEWDSQP